MIVFKAFLRIVERNKWVLIMYAAILIFFSIFSLQANESVTNFEATRPDVYVINHDEKAGVTESLIKYLAERSNLTELAENTEDVADALFYRAVNYIIEIPQDFRKDFLDGKDPEIKIQSTGDYNASLAELDLKRFLETARGFRLIDAKEPELIRDVEAALAKGIEVEMTAKRDTEGLRRAATYYNFMNYPLIMGCVYIICTVMLSFRNAKVARRIAVGGMSEKKINRILLVANSLFAIVLWKIYVLISLVIVGEAMLTMQGLCLIINSLFFTLCVTALGFLLANVIKSRNAINGITNVVGLGSSFLCGAFVPVAFLPSMVLAAAHVLPSYWYINANERISNLEQVSWESLQGVMVNWLVIGLFMIGFIVITNVLSRRRLRRG